MEAEPVVGPEEMRIVQQKLVIEKLAVLDVADLGDFAHKLQPDLVPADTTVSEDTVKALLRTVVALTLVPAPFALASDPDPPELPPPPLQHTSRAPPSRRRMMHTPSFLECDPRTLVHRQRESDAVQMVVDASNLPDGGAGLPPLSVWAADSAGTARGDAAWIAQYDAERAIARSSTE